MFHQTIYYPLALYTKYSLDVALDVWVDGPRSPLAKSR